MPSRCCLLDRGSSDPTLVCRLTGTLWDSWIKGWGIGGQTRPSKDSAQALVFGHINEV